MFEVNFNLDNINDLKDENEINDFLDSLDYALKKEDPILIPYLIKLFDEECEYTWVLDIIQNNLISLIIKDGWHYFFENLEKFLEKAPMYCSDTVSIILNSEEDQKKFVENMHLASKKDLLKLFDVMEEESPHHKSLINGLRKLLN